MLGLAELEHTKAYQEGWQKGALAFLLQILPKIDENPLET